MSTRVFACFVLSLVLLVVGCSTSSILTSTPTSTPIQADVTYSLPKTLVSIEVAERGGQVYIKSLETETVPDHEQRFAVNLQSPAHFSDDIEITVDENGLLEKVNLTTDDKRGEVIVNIAKTAAQAIDPFPSSIDPALVSAVETVFFRASFDAGKDLANVNSRLRAAAERHMRERDDWCNQAETPLTCHRLDLFVTTAQYNAIALVPERAWAAVSGAPSVSGGIGFRTRVPQTLRLEIGPLVVDSASFVAIDLQTSFAIDIKRANFVKQVANLTFNNGVLTKFELEKPSQAAAVSELFLNILKAPLVVAGEIVKLRVDVSNNEAIDLQNQLTVQQAKNDIRDLLEEDDSVEEPL